MKVLKLCLWCCLALLGASAVRAQTSTPDQDRRATDALRKEAESRARADMRAKAEAEARRMVEEQRLAAAQTQATAGLRPEQEAAARAALRSQEERTEGGAGAAAPGEAAPLAAENSGALAVIQGPVPGGESQLPPEQESAAREALRKALEQRATPTPSEAPAPLPSPGSDADAAKLEQERARAEAESRARAKREADRIMAERARPPEPVTPPPSAASVAPSAATGSSDDAAVREALRRALEEKEPVPAKPPVPPPPAEMPKPSATAPARQPIVPAKPVRAEETRAVAGSPTTPAPAGTLSNANDLALREALRKTMEERVDTEAAPAESKAQAGAAISDQRNRGQDGATARAKEPTVPSSVSPPAPKSKAQRLAELTEAYRRDEITPAQYHQERARILAEPNGRQ